MKHFARILALALAATSAVQADTVQTVDGRPLEGKISIDANGALSIAVDGKVTPVPLDKLMRAQFVAPVNKADAIEMLSELRGAKALEGFRGQAPRDIDALAQSIVSLSDFFVEHRTWLSEIEVNPVIVLEEGKGIRAVDVRPVRRD